MSKKSDMVHSVRSDEEIILSQSRTIPHNMNRSKLNRNIVLLGNPSSGKGRNFFKPNILNAQGTIVVNDPMGELLRDCGHSLEEKGYDIKVLNLDEKFKSDRYNPLDYVRKVPKEAMSLEKMDEWSEEAIAEEDAFSLAENLLRKCDDSDSRKHLEKALLESVIYYVLARCPKEERNFATVMDLFCESSLDPQTGESSLDRCFRDLESDNSQSIGVTLYRYVRCFQEPLDFSLLISDVLSKLAVFGLRDVRPLVSSDSMELCRIGMPISNDPKLQKQHLCKDSKGNLHKDGRIAYFVVSGLSESSRILADIFYSQVSQMLSRKSSDNFGHLATSCDLFMYGITGNENIAPFIDMMEYMPLMNSGLVLDFRSIEQMKRILGVSWEETFQLCDTWLMFGPQTSGTADCMSNFLRYEDKLSHDEEEIAWTIMEEKKSRCIVKVLGTEASDDMQYNLKKHPRYDLLYEPGKKKTSSNLLKKYDHLPKVREYEENLKAAKKLNEDGLHCIPDSRQETGDK